jgi:hypothetical protein
MSVADEAPTPRWKGHGCRHCRFVGTTPGVNFGRADDFYLCTAGRHSGWLVCDQDDPEPVLVWVMQPGNMNGIMRQYDWGRGLFSDSTLFTYLRAVRLGAGRGLIDKCLADRAINGRDLR